MPSSSSHTTSFLASLRGGEDGASVLERMRLVYTTPQSLRTHTCKLRRSYDGPMDEEGRRVAEEARRMARGVATEAWEPLPQQAESVSAFVEEWIHSYGQARLPPLLLDAEARVKAAREAAAEADGENAAGHPLALDVALASLSSLVRSSSSLLLPRHVRRLHVDREEVRMCVRAQRDRKLKKAAHATRVDGAALLQEARRVLGRVVVEREGASAGGDTPDGRDVLLSLLLVTGRRTCELLNGRSRFEAAVGEEEGETSPSSTDPLCDTCVFVGQAKTRSRRQGYRIPLLAPLSHVLAGMEVVRRRFPPSPPSPAAGGGESGGSRKDRSLIRSNAATTDRYGSSIRGGMRRHPVFGQVGRVHSLRGVYVWICYSRFEWGNRWISHVAYEVLGHASLAEAEAYLPLHVEGV